MSLAASHPYMRAVTDAGDSSVLLAIVIVLGIYLLIKSCWHDATALAMSFALAGGIMALLKIFFINCYGENIIPNVKSPSGHTALSIAVYGTIALIISRQLSGKLRYFPIAFFVPFICFISVTRVILHFHTMSEMIVGMVIGAIVVFTVWLVALKNKAAPSANLSLLFSCIAGLIILLCGVRAPTEDIIQSIAPQIHSYTPCGGL